jgi:hypothetical protein
MDKQYKSLFTHEYRAETIRTKSINKSKKQTGVRRGQAPSPLKLENDLFLFKDFEVTKTDLKI